MTPYEIRLDVMKLAVKILEDNKKSEVVGGPPTTYSTEDVVSTASALYNFVNDNSSSRTDNTRNKK